SAAITAHFELVGKVIAIKRAPVFHDLPPAEIAALGRPVAMRLALLGFGQAEIKQTPVGVDAMAVKVMEFRDRGARDAPAEFAWGFCRRRVTPGLHGTPERGSRAAILREGHRLRGKHERRGCGDGTDDGTHDRLRIRRKATSGL